MVGIPYKKSPQKWAFLASLDNNGVSDTRPFSFIGIIFSRVCVIATATASGKCRDSREGEGKKSGNK